MAEDSSFNVYMRLLDTRHAEVKQKYDELIDAFSYDDRDKRVKVCADFHRACVDLSRALSDSDQPAWLKSLKRESNEYAGKFNMSGQGRKLLNELIRRKESLHAQKWTSLNDGSEGDFDFDELYKRYRKDSRLPELFTTLIDILEKMLRDGEIDSITARESLQALIAVLKQNQNGSYTSTLTSRAFITSFLKNTSWQLLKRVPGVEELAAAFEETTEEFGIEIDELQAKVTKEVTDRYAKSIRPIPLYPPRDGFLDTDALKLEAPSTPEQEPVGGPPQLPSPEQEPE